MRIYCYRHRAAHNMTQTQAEKLVYGLQIALVDGLDEEESPTEVLYHMCPMDQLREYMDGEMYREHIISSHEARKVRENEDGLR